MGNQQSSQSRSTTPTAPSNPQSLSSSSVTTPASHAHRQRPSHHLPHVHVHGHGHGPPFHHTARRRESIPTLSTAKSQAAPPSASFEHAESSHYPTSIRPRSHGRAQSVANSAAIANNLRATQDSYSFRPSSQSHDFTMGNEQSKGQAKDKAKYVTPPNTTSTPTPPPLEQKAQPTPPPQQRQQQPTPPLQSLPVHVPGSSRDITPPSHAIDAIDPVSASQQEYIIPASQFSRPPRLPLPIEEETHLPGSPILASQDYSNEAIYHDELGGPLPRPISISMLSDKTMDEDDLGEEFKGPSTGRPTVPTLLEWEGEGERVYVTGTFAGWNKKYRLHKDGPSKKKDVLSAYVHITPGTHHLAFLVDNDMRTSDKLPTAVDYTNILVNYIEVSCDDLAETTPAATPATDKENTDNAKPVQERDKPPGIYPPQVIPETPDESSRFSRANAMTSNLPTPPTLPGFLGKSILNGTTPHKDDSSVLIMPNHTVLNHLATSSIKDNILATSATTRYRQKFLTTIMYKPKEEDLDRY
ncbi:hypothetical protein GQ44DRAFT_706234 [Phaeosphaeriaceae sp. PMI808]|nr:hypothetical protein GQ44DRAFT_706234 [Phaeosphaeriaceae sp. PMI808]